MNIGTPESTSALQATARSRSGFMFAASDAPCLSASVSDISETLKPNVFYGTG
jgi:hypothetical protein